MPLNKDQIKEIALGPKNKDKIEEIQKYQNRVRFHSCSIPVERELRNFLERVKGLGLTTDKFNKFKKLLVAPYPSVSLVDEINETLKKVFDGIDPDISISTVSEEIQKDTEAYVRGVCDINFFRDYAWDVSKENYNAIMMVDLPREQSSKLPQPYLYFRDVSTLHDFEDNDGDIKWFSFVEDDILYIYDDQYYRGYEYKEKKLGDIVFENRHGLGECPGTFFFTDIMSNEKRYIKRHPISNKVSDLDWFLFLNVAKKHLDSYAGFPIYWGFQEDCDFEDPVAGVECERGLLRKIESKAYIWGEGDSIAQCPKCKESKMIGPGTYYDVEPPSEYNDKVNLRDPVGIISIDVKSLDYNTKEVTRIGSEIYSSVVGNSYDIASQMSLNEMQIQYLIEGKRNAIKNFKVNWENAQKWATNIICKLRYGDYYLGCKVSYGNDWYLFEDYELTDLYERGKKEKWSQVSLDYFEDLAYATKFKNSPEQYHRYKLLNALMPVRHKTDEDLYKMFDKGLIGYDEMYIQINFSSLISKFERQYGNILSFGPSQMEFKVETISNLIKNYINDDLRKKALSTSEEIGVNQQI